MVDMSLLTAWNEWKTQCPGHQAVEIMFIVQILGEKDEKE